MTLTNNIKQEIIRQMLDYNPEFIALFGSYARNEQNSDSDLDILVSFNKRLTLIDLSRIKNQISDKLNIKIDLITEKAMHPKLKSYIEKDLEYIYHPKISTGFRN